MKTTLIICPGVHDSQLTDSFVKCLKNLDQHNSLPQCLVFPATKYPPYSPLHLLEFLKQAHLKPSPLLSLIFLAFSAGVVGAIGAANLWQLGGGKVKAFIAVDGWGVPLVGNFPLHRISHDYFTHWSSGLISIRGESFYAQPDVSHLDLWRSPNTAWGWREKSSGIKIRTNAAEFIKKLLLSNPA
jgi:hypothetical protein